MNEIALSVGQPTTVTCRETSVQASIRPVDREKKYVSFHCPFRKMITSCKYLVIKTEMKFLMAGVTCSLSLIKLIDHQATSMADI